MKNKTTTDQKQTRKDEEEVRREEIKNRRKPKRDMPKPKRKLFFCSFCYDSLLVVPCVVSFSSLFIPLFATFKCSFRSLPRGERERRKGRGRHTHLLDYSCAHVSAFSSSSLLFFPVPLFSLLEVDTMVYACGCGCGCLFNWLFACSLRLFSLAFPPCGGPIIKLHLLFLAFFYYTHAMTHSFYLISRALR